MIHHMRRFTLPLLGALTLLCLWGGQLAAASYGLASVFGALLLLGIWDLNQPAHSILRNYPVLGHLRFLLEDVGPELRQYVVEHNLEGRPFDRDTRSLVYQRAKGVLDKKAFGTELDVYEPGHRWMTHSIAAKHASEDPVRDFRVRVGGAECSQPYEASILNISAMSFGSLSGAAIRALNGGANAGHFAHNTGEGGVSVHHKESGGDLIWQVGTGYYGCRRSDGGFDADAFRECASQPSVKMIELKLSQGAKPGHGGILPANKVTSEIAAARGIPIGIECQSPPGHRTFSTPLGLLEYIAELRGLCGGKPVGFKLCLGEPLEFLSICKAMHETGLLPDFITVDGGEGGTGAAPIEFSDHMGMPVLEALVVVHNALRGIGVREMIRVFGAGKLVTSIDIATSLALGADGVNTARGFMLALGCIQSQLCHTNTCPVGVATQNPGLARAIHVPSKAERVRSYHEQTVKAFAEVLGAAGLERPADLAPRHIYQRVSPWEIRPFSQLYPTLSPGSLIDGRSHGFLGQAWSRASSTSFQGG